MSNAKSRIEPFFLTSPHGQLFCLFHSPNGTSTKGSVLYLHPFAEEMHKSRHMAALQARALAQSGYAVLQIDLTGCGDSTGDFADANWSTWLDDARLGHAWLREATGLSITLWGLRTGGLLAAEAACRLDAVDRLILWQPVTDGAQFLTQFLRIKVASEAFRNSKDQTSTPTLKAQLEQGVEVEVGGNMLSPSMARELGSAELADIKPPCPVNWLDTCVGPELRINSGSQGVIDAWQAKGVDVQAQIVNALPFWNTQEIRECPDLINATLACFPS